MANAATTSNAASTASETPQTSAFARGFIVGPWYDLTFFILSPLLAFGLGYMLSGTEIAYRPLMLGGTYSNSLMHCAIGTFIFAHLFAVFFRSHLNQNIFKTYPLRFTLVPFALFMAMNFSAWISVSVAVLATWWDVYHSSLQTFGIGRIYDMKRGNDPLVGRQLDRWFNLLLYAGPILAGATLMDHVEDFDSFREVDSIFFSSIPAYVESNSRWFTWSIIGLGVPFTLFYLFAYWRFAQQGYQISWQKITLIVTTGAVSIYTWGFNTFGEAFFIMNFFHAWQYFAIVWWSERKNMMQRMHVGSHAWGAVAAMVVFLLIAFGYGFWAETTDTSRSMVLFNLIIVVSIMHFWYDGFIWSVRKKQV